MAWAAGRRQRQSNGLIHAYNGGFAGSVRHYQGLTSASGLGSQIDDLAPTVLSDHLFDCLLAANHQTFTVDIEHENKESTPQRGGIGLTPKRG